MMTIAGFSVPRLFERPRAAAPKRRSAPAKTLRLLEISDLGESIATGVHAIYAAVRIYLCVTMEPKADALARQIKEDRKLAAGHFDVDTMWSAAAVNARWAKNAVLCDEAGHVLENAVIGARGMTDAGAKEVFFEFNAQEHYPERLYLSDGQFHLRVR